MVQGKRFIVYMDLYTLGFEDYGLHSSDSVASWVEVEDMEAVLGKGR